MIEAKLEKTEIEKLQRFFNATRRQMNAAENYALSDTVKHLKSQLLKKVSTEEKIQSKILNSRLHISSLSEIKRTKTARLWFGTYKISLARLKPRQIGKGGTKRRKNSRAGVVAGIGSSIFRQGAFLMPIKKKTGEAAIVPYQVMKRVGQKRLPIRKETVKYEETARAYVQQIQSQLPQKLIDTLRKKLKWQTEKS